MLLKGCCLLLALGFVGLVQTAIICPDQVSQCPDGTTCCQLDGGVYGCCPIEHAVCCEDHIHCCPEDTTCDTEHSTCRKGSLRFPIHRKHPSTPASNHRAHSHSHHKQQHHSTPQQNSEFGAWAAAFANQKHMNQDHLGKEQQQEVTCPDKKSKCPAHTTCCPLDSGFGDASPSDFVALGPVEEEEQNTVYGCCPAEHAVCCPDKLHCCPQGTTCDTEEGRCNQQETGLSRLWLSKFRSTKIVRKQAVEFAASASASTHEQEEVECADGSKCGKMHTCCQSSADNGYQCCPLSKATCCTDACCPQGYACIAGKRCEKSSLAHLLSSFTDNNF